MPTWLKQGIHRYYCEDNVLFFELHGPFNLQDTKCMMDLTDSLASEHGYFLLVFDAREGLNMTAEGRQYLNESAWREPAEGATLLIGASLAVRTMTQLLLNAAKLFGKKPPKVYFCDAPDDLPAWIAAQRQLYRQKLAGTAPD